MLNKTENDKQNNEYIEMCVTDTVEKPKVINDKLKLYKTYCMN